MTDDRTDVDALAVVRALGQADPPDPAVLVAARERLWSAITDELLSGSPATDAGPRESRARPRSAVRPRPDLARPVRRHRGDGSR